MDTKLKKFNWLRFGITAATITLLSVFALLGTTFWAKSIADANMQSYLIQNYSDELTYYSYTDNYYYQGQGYYFRQFNIGFIICILLLVCALGFGLSMIRRCGIGRGFWGRIPLELYLFVGIFVLTNMIPMFAGVCNLIMYDNLPEKLYSMFLIPYSLGVFLSYASLFISYWCTFFVAFQGAASLGAGLRDGLKSYFIKSTLVGICCAWCYRWAKKVAVRLSRVDLSSPLEKNLFRLIGLNALLVLGVCYGLLFLVFGPAMLLVGGFLVLIYSGIVFFWAYKKLSQLRESYSVVLESTQQMAQGNLNNPIGQDLGMLNPLRDSLNSVQEGFAHAVEQEVRSRNMKTELIANVSHDLKTPLTSIITYVDLLKKPDLDEQTRQDYLNTLDRKSQRLKQLIEDLFEVSKAATGNVTMNPELLDLVALLRQVQCETEDSTSASGVDFRWNLPIDKVPVVLDGQRSCRIFENLINNITKYAMKGSRAYISLEIQENMAVVSFKNVSAQELSGESSRLTERFVRGDASRSTEGSGLGLAIVKSFTELQHGIFTLETEGDLFKVWVKFPLAFQ